MRFEPSFIQTSLVGGDPVETQVRVLLSSSYVRDEMEGPTVWRGRDYCITVDVSSPLNPGEYSPTLRDMLWPLLSGILQV